MDPSKYHASSVASQSKGKNRFSFFKSKSLSTGKKQNNFNTLNSQVSEIDPTNIKDLLGKGIKAQVVDN